MEKTRFKGAGDGGRDKLVVVVWNMRWSWWHCRFGERGAV